MTSRLSLTKLPRLEESHQGEERRRDIKDSSNSSLLPVQSVGEAGPSYENFMNAINHTV
jgi:hypothetical protein